MATLCLIILSAAGHAEEILQYLSQSTIAVDLEPLVVGLQIFLGKEHPLVAQEILEVGQDVAAAIRAQQSASADPKLHSS
ncbi:MAG: hypothetical protein HC851_15325 [Acaryochloris sp. RU_4_1]|nr:hypothetical protein [Acaryochloris sp. RU_4_1]NJR55774.1 hypothetical protein [Acaryochloris sp. CRU_2_0]